MPSGYCLSVGFKVCAEPRVIAEIYQSAAFGESVNHS